jgi:hypothetical protein
MLVDISPKISAHFNLEGTLFIVRLLSFDIPRLLHNSRLSPPPTIHESFKLLRMMQMLRRSL